MLRMWTYDLAREQAPTTEHLDRLCRLSQDAGYDALGLYLEHRFEYASAPWAAGKGALTAETVAWLRREHPSLRLIPFANLLGHMEGFLYASGGEYLAEERFKGMQAAPANPQVAAFARGLLDDVLRAFDDEIVHIGGDETQQLRGEDKAGLYGGYFGPMAEYVVGQGRRPGVWGDMFLEHPSALESLPKETLVFDWQYFGSPLETSRKFVQAGHEVVLCPTIHVYNAPWCHLPQTERNVREHAEAARELGAFGVCVTTWEGALFASYETLLPAISGCGAILSEGGDESPEGGLLILEDALPIRIEPNDELPDPYADRESPFAQLVDSIVAQFVASGLPRLDMVSEADRLAIHPRFGQLPLDMAPNVLARLHLVANLSPLRSREVREGRVAGTFDGEPFELRAESFPNAKGVVFSLFNDKATRVDYATLHEAPTLLRAYLKAGERHEEWARLMGVELQEAGGPFAFSGIRSSIKARFLLYGNPFLLWLRNREDLLGEPGDKALAILDRAIAFAPDSGHRGVSEFVKIAIQCVRFTEEAAQAYAAGKPGVAAAALAPMRPAFDDLARIARATNLRIGGSLADVERVMRRIKQYGDGSLGYLPSFETISHPKFMPHDQGNWWLINSWANE